MSYLKLGEEWPQEDPITNRMICMLAGMDTTRTMD